MKFSNFKVYYSPEKPPVSFSREVRDYEEKFFFFPLEESDKKTGWYVKPAETHHNSTNTTPGELK